MGTPDPGQPSRGGGRPAELAEHPGVITTTVVSGVIAVAKNDQAHDALAAQFKSRDVENFLGTRMSIELPYDPFLYLKASNEGVPIVTGAARSVVADRLVKLSATAFGEDGRSVPGMPDELKQTGLFRFRR